MNLPVPGVIKKALEEMKAKSDRKDDSEGD